MECLFKFVNGTAAKKHKGALSFTKNKITALTLQIRHCQKRNSIIFLYFSYVYSYTQREISEITTNNIYGSNTRVISNRMIKLEPNFSFYSLHLYSSRSIIFLFLVLIALVYEIYKIFSFLFA